MGNSFIIKGQNGTGIKTWAHGIDFKTLKFLSLDYDSNYRHFDCQDD